MIDGDWRKEAVADGRMRGQTGRDRRISYIKENTRFGEMSKVIDSVMSEHGGLDWLTRKWRRTSAIRRRNKRNQ